MFQHIFGPFLLLNTVSLLCSAMFQKTKVLSQNATATTSNQHLYISTSGGSNGGHFSEMLKELDMIPQEFHKINF